MEAMREPAPPMTPAPIVRHLAGVASVALFAVLPAALLAAFLAAAIGNDYAFDFHQFWQGGRDVLDGVSPYPTAAQIAAAGDSLDPHGIQDVFRFPYPAGAAVAMVPFGALPFGLAAAILTVLLVGATIASLRVLGVSDWRCYGVVFIWMTTLGAIRLGTLTPLLVLALAMAWRYRDRTRIVAAAVAFAIVLKLFLWPLAVWLAATRRFAAAALTLVLAAAVTLLAWLAIGLDGLTDYPDLVRKLTDVVGDRGYSLDALAASAGGGSAGVVLRMGAAAIALAAVVAVARRGGDASGFALALAAAVLATPIVWLHYFMLLLVPIAIARPRLSPLWFVPLAYWVTPFQESDGELWRIAVGLGTAAIAFALALRMRPTSIGRPTAVPA
jgi:hypothetical protein